MEAELITLSLSVGSIIFGLVLWLKADYLTKNGIKTEAVVFKNVYRNDGIGAKGGMYYPVVRFLTEEKEWITHEMSGGNSSADPPGTKLDVIYDPGDPTNLVLASPMQMKVLPLLLMCIGVIGFLFGILGVAGAIEFPKILENQTIP